MNMSPPSELASLSLSSSLEHQKAEYNNQVLNLLNDYKPSSTSSSRILETIKSTTRNQRFEVNNNNNNNNYLKHKDGHSNHIDSFFSTSTSLPAHASFNHFRNNEFYSIFVSILTAAIFLIFIMWRWYRMKCDLRKALLEQIEIQNQERLLLDNRRQSSDSDDYRSNSTSSNTNSNSNSNRTSQHNRRRNPNRRLSSTRRWASHSSSNL
jgi:hypothetical protein